MSSKKISEAVILAGGEGTRLRPYTVVLPKPLVPLGDRPILQILLSQLKEAGIEKITMSVGYLAELLQAYFGDGKALGLEIEYSIERKPLGTVGPLRLVKNLPDDFLMLNGDIFTDLDFAALSDFHLSRNSLLTIACYRKRVKVDLGVIDIDDGAKVNGYHEKPEFNYPVSMGVYALKREIVELVPDDEYLDFPHLVEKMLSLGREISVFEHEGEWYDLGNAMDHQSAQESSLFGRIQKK